MATRTRPGKGIRVSDKPNVGAAQRDRNRARLAQIAAQARKAVYLARDGQVIGEIERQRCR